MIPQIIQLGPIPINSFGLCIALAIFAAIILLQRSFKIAGINPDLAENYVITAGLVGLLGARLWYIFTFYDQVKYDLVGALFSSAGFIFYGGFMLSTIVIIIMTRFHKIKLSQFADTIGPAMVISYAVGRLGCQLSGDGDYGITTNSILGMSYSSGVIPTEVGTYAFPTPLYESAICMLILLILLKVESIEKYRLIPYFRLGLYLTLIGLERFAIEFIRINEKVVGIFSQAQVLAVIIVAIGLFLIMKKRRQVYS